MGEGAFIEEEMAGRVPKWRGRPPHLASWLSMKKWCVGGFGGGKEKMVEVSGSG
jgi:hypothetical protein